MTGLLACGLFVPTKRCASWGSPFDEKVKCSDLLLYWRYFVAVQAAREALTNSGKGSDAMYERGLLRSHVTLPSVDAWECSRATSEGEEAHDGSVCR